LRKEAEVAMAMGMFEVRLAAALLVAGQEGLAGVEP
jgi:hypothetical protein